MRARRSCVYCRVRRGDLLARGARRPNSTSVHAPRIAVMPSRDFVHLHVHTEYSMLDGAARIGDLMKRANELGQKAIATTDHGYLFGAYEFWSQATKAGVKPIIGLEAYLTPGTARSDRSRVKWGQEGQAGDDVSSGGAYTHATMWARDTAGMHNLFRMAVVREPRGALLQGRAWTATFCSATRRASSPPRAAPPARCRPGSAWASTTRRSRLRASSRTSSARTRTTSSSWTTASRSRRGSTTT